MTARLLSAMPATPRSQPMRMTLVPDIRAAMKARGVSGFTPESLALHTQAVLQGALHSGQVRKLGELHPGQASIILSAIYPCCFPSPEKRK